MVGGMNTSISDFDDLKSIGTGFKEAFSDKEFEGKDSNYPYSQDYYEDIRDNAKLMLGDAWNAAINELSEVNLGGSSGSEAVRQARLNASDLATKPNRVEISTYDSK